MNVTIGRLSPQSSKIYESALMDIYVLDWLNWAIFLVKYQNYYVNFVILLNGMKKQNDNLYI